MHGQDQYQGGSALDGECRVDSWDDGHEHERAKKRAVRLTERLAGCLRRLERVQTFSDTTPCTVAGFIHRVHGHWAYTALLPAGKHRASSHPGSPEQCQAQRTICVPTTLKATGNVCKQAGM
jgi:hypothetical protein